MSQPPNYILVIEDEPVINKKIVKQLANLTNLDKIKSTTSIKESLELLDAFKFDIIILDLNLNDGNGIEVLSKVRKNNLGSLVYVFSICSELAKISLNKGATAFFDKSKGFDDLISTVKTTIQKNF